MQSERNEQRSSPVAIDDAIAALFPAKVFDDNALTTEEMMKRSGLGRAQTERKLKDAVEAGTWEQVFKRAESGRIAKAYRPKA